MYNITEVPTCAICLEDIVRPDTSLILSDCDSFMRNVSITAKCGHVFHRYCLEPWVKNSAICPLDRKTFSGKVASISIKIDFEDAQEFSNLSTDIKIKDVVDIYKSKLPEECSLKYISNNDLVGFDRVNKLIDLDKTFLDHCIIDEDCAFFRFWSKNTLNRLL